MCFIRVYTYSGEIGWFFLGFVQATCCLQDARRLRRFHVTTNHRTTQDFLRHHFLVRAMQYYRGTDWQIFFTIKIHRILVQNPTMNWSLTEGSIKTNLYYHQGVSNDSKFTKKDLKVQSVDQPKKIENTSVNLIRKFIVRPFLYYLLSPKVQLFPSQQSVFSQLNAVSHTAPRRTIKATKYWREFHQQRE